MSAEATIESIINEALSSAQQAQDAADDYSRDAQNAAATITLTASAPSIGEVTVPDLEAPSVDLGGLFQGESSSEAGEIKAMLESELADFLNTYFPCGWISKMQNICNWIDDAVVNGGTGLHPSIEQAIWDRGRGREANLNERLEEEAAGGPASMGWQVPPAAVTRRSMAATQEQVNRDSTFSRDVAIKQAELEQSNIRFAITSGIQLQTSIMQAALNFIGAKLRAEALGQQYASTLANATRQFYNQTVQYYQAQIQGEELILRQDIADVERFLSQSRVQIDALVQSVRNRTEAAMAAARTMGDIAASARSTTNTMASIANETTKEE